jgi:hypothetical protein
MPVTIGPGWSIGPGWFVGGEDPIITANLTMWVDAQNSASYSGSGTTWADLSGNGANLTLVNSPVWTSSTPAYFTFASASSQSGTGSTPNVLPSTQYTKTVWFRLNSYVDNNIVSSESGGHFMYFAGGSTMYCGHTNWPSYSAFPSTSTFSLNTWYYAAVTFNTTDGMKLYVNGTLNATYTANLSPHGGDGSTNVGRFGAGNFMNGRVSEFYCYNTSLTASQVLQNYNATKARYGY